MTIIQSAYQSIFRRTSTFVVAIVIGAFAFERAVDKGGDALWSAMNQGKLWPHIAHKYEKKDEEDEE